MAGERYDSDGPGGMSDSDTAPTKVSSDSGGGSSLSSRPAKKPKSKARTALGDAGREMNERSVEDLRDQAREEASRIVSYKRGGTKRGDGPARLHKNERITAPKRKKS